jgi:hypothetical protein
MKTTRQPIIICDEGKILTIPSFISGNETKVFRLRFGTFSHTSGYSAFELMGSYDVELAVMVERARLTSDTSISVLEVDG